MVCIRDAMHERTCDSFQPDSASTSMEVEESILV